jgi:hypothetical protein
MDTLGAYGIVNPKPDKPFRIAFSEQFHSCYRAISIL